MAVLLAMLLTGIVISGPSMARAAEPEETHVLDATMSLTGNCESSKLDPVPDPSCPAEAPHGAFIEPYGVAIDAHGDLYYYGKPPEGTHYSAKVYMYVFDASGHFITEVPTDTALEETRDVAVDSEGNLYIVKLGSKALYVLHPSRYVPEAGEISYENPPVQVSLGGTNLYVVGLVIDNANDRIFAVLAESGGSNMKYLVEFASYAEGNGIERTFGTNVVPFYSASNVAIAPKAERIYVAEQLVRAGGYPKSGIQVLDFAGNLVETITGVQTPAGFHEFSAPGGGLGVAVDEATGHLFISDFQNNPTPAVYELNGARETVSIITHSFQPTNSGGPIAVDNGADSPHSAENPTSPISREENPHGSYLFVPSGVSGTGHLYAFAPKPLPKPPLIEAQSVTGISNTEAVLKAKINPNGLATEYQFEYVSAATFEADIEASGPGHGFDHAAIGGEGTLVTANEGISVAAPLQGLDAGTAYRFRVVARNACEGEGMPACEEEGEAVAFGTFPVPVLSAAPCANAGLRTGPSAVLPDCRAYELVTPADTNGHATLAPTENGGGPRFGTPTVTASGEAAAFLTRGGALPGYGGTGAFNGDTYVAQRSAGGWRTASVGPSGALSSNPQPGGLSPDLEYLAFATGPEDIGSLAVSQKATYVRRPDGSYSLIGEGSLETDPAAEPLLISLGGAHVVFMTSAARLEAAAPPSGTATIYDRTRDGVVHVVSLLPGDITPAAGEDAHYLGASPDGNAVAFELGSAGLGGPLYVRLDDSGTLEAAPAGSTFEGLSADGRYVFYLLAGDLYRYDTESESTLSVTGSGDATVVNLPSSGTSAYFVSETVLGGSGARNPRGARPVAGVPNLYYWDGGRTRFVASLSERDMNGEFTGGGGGTRDGLGLWVSDIRAGSTAVDPSRTTASGEVLVFESNSALTGYDSGGASEIYRYDAGADTLSCLSCAPTLATATGDARLQTVSFEGYGPPTDQYAQVPNLSGNGDRAFFESPDALVPADTNGVRDVYEWEADGEGSCTANGGCVFLISSGTGVAATYLYGVSATGDDVFIDTSDLLTGEDGDETPSIYDVRVGGGFPPPPARAAECLGEACQPEPSALVDPTPASASFVGVGNMPGAHKGKARTKAGCSGKHREPARMRRSRTGHRKHRSHGTKTRAKGCVRRHHKKGHGARRRGHPRRRRSHHVERRQRGRRGVVRRPRHLGTRRAGL